MKEKLFENFRITISDKIFRQFLSIVVRPLKNCFDIIFCTSDNGLSICFLICITILIQRV
jgi:hypothetical protein